MDKFDRAYINSSRWLRNEEEGWMQVELPSNDELLLVAPRQGARLERRIRRANVEVIQYPGCLCSNRLLIEKAQA